MNFLKSKHTSKIKTPKIVGKNREKFTKNNYNCLGNNEIKQKDKDLHSQR